MTDTIRTDTPTTVFFGQHPVTGRIWRVRPLPNTDTDAEGAAYTARNAGKERDVHVFLGVPYARQPVGPHRFRPAVKVAPSGPIDASRHGPVAPQGYFGETSDRGLGRSDLGRERGLSAWAALGTFEAENCLHMSFFTPNPNRRLPVVVQFHGGASNYLSSTDDRMAGHRLCLKGVVVVRVEYRVGNLGHFWLPDMEGVPGMAGTVNHSITDMLAAAQFIRDHVGAVGGDPEQITFTGGSAGGNMVQCAVVNPAFAGLVHRWWSSSASAGFVPRVREQSVIGMPSFQDWCGTRLEWIQHFAPRLPDSQDSSRTLADAINAVGISDAVRAHMRLTDFMALDEGREGVALVDGAGPFNGYDATRSLTICQDFKSVFHSTNRDAALAGAFPALDAVIGVCENEYSVVFPATSAAFFNRQLQHVSGGMTARQWAESPIYSTEWNGNAATPPWGAVDNARLGLPWTALEPSRMIFNHGYAHAAYCAARAVVQAGSTAYLYHFNYNALANPAPQYTGHTADEPYMFGNPQWDLPPPMDGPPEALRTRDIQMADIMSQQLANFAATGNPNTAYSSEWDFDLFATAHGQVLTPFSPAQRNWNVYGNPFRSAANSPATITNYPNFWAHAMNIYDARYGVIP
jgi:carboxylesterase type B